MKLKLEDLMSCNREIYIAGAGEFGKKLARYLETKHIMWSGVVDRKEKDFLGKQTITYNRLNKKGIYIISSIEYEDEIAKELMLQGVCEHQIYSINDSKIIKEIFDVAIDYSHIYGTRIKELKDKHKGEKCFVIGNGPSLQIKDLERIKDIKSFGCNSIYDLFEYTSWRPTYYVASDGLMTGTILYEEVEKVVNDVEYIFTSVNSRMIELKNQYQNILYMLQMFSLEDESFRPKFSNKCHEIVHLSGTVSYQMLQLAIYLGFKEIYLLGMDCTYAIEKQKDGSFKHNDILNHHDIMNKRDLEFVNRGLCDNCWADIYQQMEGYSAAREYAENNGIKIYNATRGGKLEVFERVNFDKLFE